MALAEPVKVARKPRFFHGWTILAVTFVTSMISAGVGGYGLSFFLVPMSHDLGVTRTEFSGITLAGLAVLPFMPLMGRLVDKKHGPRLILVIGGTVGGLLLILVSQIHALWQFYVLYGLYAGAVSVGGQIVGPAVLTKWFVRMRGRALAIGTMGISTGGLVVAPIAGWLVTTYGWRTAWALLGVLVIAAIVPWSALFMRRSPEDMGLLPDGDTPRPAHTGGSASVAIVDTEYPWTLKEALRTRAAWVLMGAQALGSMGLFPVVVHQVAFVEEKGFSVAVATTIATTVAFFSMAGKVPWGLLTERFHVRWVTAACMISAGLSLTLLIFADSLPMLILYAVIYGATMSGLPSLTNIIWAHYFGRRHTGAIRGALSPAVQALSSASPVIVAYFWDLQGNYTFAFWLVTGFWIAGGLLSLLAAQPRPPKAMREASTN